LKPAKTLSDFASIVAGEDPPLIVGGQAVNLWCLAFEKLEPKAFELLRQFAPFVSKDCDVFGDRALLARLRYKSGLKAREYKFGCATCCVGFLYAADDPDQTPIVEVLSRVHGLSSGEIGEGQPVVLDKVWYRTMNPLQLLKAKLANACDLPQENRQDVRHVQMLVICVRAYLTYTHRSTETSNVQEVKFLKRMLNHCLALVKSDNARKVQKRFEIKLFECFPWNC